MLLTLYYMYATLLQCWRLALTKAKISSVLSEKSSVVLYQKNRPVDNKTKNNIEHLLYTTEEKVACTVVPKQTVSLGSWISFSSCKFFPFSKKKIRLSGVPNITLLIQADMKNCNNSNECNQLQVSDLGEPVAWTAVDNFSIIMKTDLDKFTKLVSCFLANPIAINDGMEVLRVEMIDLEGEPKMTDSERIFKKYKWPKIISNQRQWRHLSEDLKSICKKITQASHSHNGNVHNDLHISKTNTENEKLISKTHLSVTKRDIHTENKPRIKIDKPDDKHKTEKKSHKKSEKTKTSTKTDTTESEKKKKDKTQPEKEKEDKNKSKISPKIENLPSTSNVISPITQINSENKNNVNGKIIQEVTKELDKDKDVDETEIIKEPAKIQEKTVRMKIRTPKLDRKKYTPSIDEKLDYMNENLNKMTSTKEKLEKLKTKQEKDMKPIKQSSSSMDESKIENDNSSDNIEIKEKIKVKHKRTKEKVFDKQQISTSLEELDGSKHKKCDIKEKKHKHSKHKLDKAELSSSLEEDQIGSTENVESHTETKEKLKLRRPKDLTPDKDRMKQSSSLDRIKHKDCDKHKHDTRTKRESFAKRHSDDKLMSKNVEIDKDISKCSEKDTLVGKKRFVKAKPPNVLVYADSPATKENAKNVLKQVLNGNKYVIYEMGEGGHTHLADNCSLAVICGNVPPALTGQLLRFLLTGGQMLCLCSDLLNSVLHTFATAEVREHELVRFSYGEWRRVRMMHHIFCYQASPVRKHFSQDSDCGSGSNHSPVAPRTPSTVELHHEGLTYTVYVQVLGTEETWHTPSILLAKIKGGHGKAVFSQVHLEMDPNSFEDDEQICTTLKDSDKSRLEILKDILSNHLDMDCSNDENAVIEYVPAYFLGRNDLKQSFLSELSGLKENVLRLPKLTLQFCGKGDQPVPTASEKFLPVLLYSCPSTFSTVTYFENLKTEHIGRLVLYTDLITSSMNAITGAKLAHGFTVIPRQQTSGVGRGGNLWLSPPGGALFSSQVLLPRGTPLADRLPLLQHLVAVASVSCVKTLKGYQHLDIGVKWPNDMYAYSSVKIGGCIVNSMIDGTNAVCNIGRLVLYTDLITSSMNAITGAKLAHGFTVIPRQQTSGVGRGGNLWLSPPGGALFSSQVLLPRGTPLADRLPLLQHLVAVASVSCVKTLKGYQHLDIGVKWPNDMYAYSSVKIGGCIVNSMIDGTNAVCNIGCLVLYSDLITSSMNAITGAKLSHGFTVIPRQQTSGVGRGGNLWLSPPGGALFSSQVLLPRGTPLADRLPLLQHLVAVASVSCVKTLKGYQHLDIGVKWPNDMYAYSSVKIGGCIVNSMIDGTNAVCNIGLGMNLNNAQPTTCINSIITKYNEENGTTLSLLSVEQYLALMFNEFERILKIVQEENFNYAFEIYYKYWLHSDSIISVQTAEGLTKDVSIVGIDEYGFLRVKSKDGTTSSVQPDDNTFDMMQGLIAPKIR